MTMTPWVPRWTRAMAWCVVFAAAGCLTGPDDPDDAMGEPVPQGEGVQDEFKFEWEQQTSPTETAPRFPEERGENDETGEPE